MKTLDALTKSLILLFKESHLEDADSLADSKNLVSAILDFVDAPIENESLPVTGDAVVVGLVDMIIDTMETANSPIDRDSFLSTVRLVAKDNNRIYDIIESGSNIPEDPALLNRHILDLKRILTNYIKEKKIGRILRRAFYDFTRKRSTIKDTNEFIRKHVMELEALELRSTNKNKGVVEIDVSDTESLGNVLSEIKDIADNSGIIRTGWQDMNEMFQGGMRRGEFVCHSALQHNYKTGMNLSLFIHAALFNKPYLFDKKKKPLLVRISFEDDMTNNIAFMYTYLKYAETREPVDTKGLDIGEMSNYIKERMSATGFAIKMYRVNPNDWTYHDIHKTISDLEASGYEIHLLAVDYLALVPTIGCTQGPAGVDIRNLFNRIRNYCGVRKITFVTPHQMSPDAKSLLRNGLPEEMLVREVANKGYYSGSKQLDQEIDLEFYQHIVVRKHGAYLTIQRGKHRVPTVIPEDKKYFVLPFPKEMPIPPDVDLPKKISLKAVPLDKADDDEDLF